MVPNDTMLAMSKPNKYETCQQKITILLTNKRHMLVDSYFCTYVSHLLDFDTGDMVLCVAAQYF